MKTSQFINNIPEDIRLSPLGHCKPLSELVLDPRVWEENGRIEGWGDEKLCFELGMCADENCCEIIKTDDHKKKMHQMIKARIDGKSLQDFISTL